MKLVCIPSFICAIFFVKIVIGLPVKKFINSTQGTGSIVFSDKGAVTNTNNLTLSRRPEVTTRVQLSLLIKENPDNTTWEEFTLTDNISFTTDVSINTTSGSGADFHSSFNLAIIPVVAATVFIVAVCLKCCQWFRRYTRGGYGLKESSTYATIVQEGEEDYGHVDMLSESASTNYDTVSSFCSFMRRGTNDGTVTSFRSLRDGEKFTDSPRRWVLSRMNQGKVPVVKSEIITSDSVTSLSSNLRSALKNNSARPCSTSSEDTEMDPLSSSDASNLRRNRFRVSFVTDYTQTNTPSDSPNSNRWFEMNNIKRPPSNLKQEPDFSVVKTSVPAKPSANHPEMASVGTQTNKSFRYSLRKAQLKRRHCSDSGVDPRESPPPRDQFVFDADKRLASRDSACVSSTFEKRKTKSTENNYKADQGFSDNINRKKQLPYPIEPNIKISNECKSNSCENAIVETDLTDDVFVTQEETDVDVISSQNICFSHKPVSENVSLRPATDKRYTELNKNDTDLTNVPKLRLSQSMSVPSDLRAVRGACNCKHTRDSDMFLGKYTKTQANERLETCKQVMVEPDQALREPDRSVRVSECGCAHNVCKNCGETLTKSKPKKQPSPQSGRKRNNSSKSDTRTLSVTSLESSGYAEELSSDDSLHAQISI